MNKKMIRARRYIQNRLHKQAEQRGKRFARFEAEKKSFRIDMVGERRFEELVKTPPAAMCVECGKKIMKKDFKSRGFVALAASVSGKEYFLHNHFFEADRKTELTDARKNLNTVYRRIFEIEFAEFAEFLEENRDVRI